MPREFLIYSQLDGTCSTKEKEREPVHTFSDILEALDYVRSECRHEAVHITALDCTGKVTFSADSEH